MWFNNHSSLAFSSNTREVYISGGTAILVRNVSGAEDEKADILSPSPCSSCCWWSYSRHVDSRHRHQEQQEQEQEQHQQEAGGADDEGGTAAAPAGAFCCCKKEEHQQQ
mmetsp:Transcript_13463/g.33876  ORF Transcript_13463/g.33876 Transcript_13463/m.33876 type:complete len:109 (+) Transcript_13463:1237-1563(+)